MKTERQHGFSLIELLVGMVVGLIVLIAIGSVYLSTRQTALTNSAVSYMQDSGKLALELLATHVAHAGFIGRTAVRGTIVGTASDTTPLPYIVSAGTECATNWAIDLLNPLRVFDGTNPYAATCINGVTTGATQWTWAAGTDVLELRNVGTTSLIDNPPLPGQPATTAGVIYLIGDINSGRLFFGNSSPPVADFSPGSVGAYPVNSYVYFVAQRSTEPGVWYPSLMRVETAGATQIRRVEVVPGVEDMEIEVGVDNDLPLDGQVDQWLSPTVGMDFNTVTGLRVWLLMRAPELDISFNPDRDDITYTLGQKTVTRNDQFRRLTLMRTMRMNVVNGGT